MVEEEREEETHKGSVWKQRPYENSVELSRFLMLTVNLGFGKRFSERKKEGNLLNLFFFFFLVRWIVDMQCNAGQGKAQNSITEIWYP